MASELKQCPLCGGTRLRTDRIGTWERNLAAPHAISYCRGCTLRFLNPRPSEEEYRQLYGQQSGPLAELYPGLGEFYAREDNQRLGEYRAKLTLLEAQGYRGRLLELGACTGIFLNEARNAGWDVAGIEPGEENRRLARDRYGLELISGAAEDQDFPEGSFDVVFSSHVFEHLMDPLNVCRKIHRWLKPGGAHLMEIPNEFCSFPSRVRRVAFLLRPRARSVASIHHTMFFSPRTVRVLMRSSGFQACHVRNVFYRYPTFLRRVRLVFETAVDPWLGGADAIEVLARKAAQEARS